MRPVLPPLLDPSLVDGLVQGHVDPVTAELDPLGPARLDGGAAARATGRPAPILPPPASRDSARILLPPLPAFLMMLTASSPSGARRSRCAPQLILPAPSCSHGLTGWSSSISIHCFPCSFGAGASQGKPASDVTSLLLLDARRRRGHWFPNSDSRRRTPDPAAGPRRRSDARSAGVARCRLAASWDPVRSARQGRQPPASSVPDAGTSGGVDARRSRRSGRPTAQLDECGHARTAIPERRSASGRPAHPRGGPSAGCVGWRARREFPRAARRRPSTRSRRPRRGAKTGLAAPTLRGCRRASRCTRR